MLLDVLVTIFRFVDPYLFLRQKQSAAMPKVFFKPKVDWNKRRAHGDTCS